MRNVNVEFFFQKSWPFGLTAVFMQYRSSKICLNLIFYVQVRNCIFVKTGFHSSISCQKRRWSSLILLEWIWFSLILEGYELNWALKCLKYAKYVQSYGAEVEYVFPFLHCERLKKSRTHIFMCWILSESTAAAGIELRTRRLRDGRYTSTAMAETLRQMVLTCLGIMHACKL